MTPNAIAHDAEKLCPACGSCTCPNVLYRDMPEPICALD